ncbi:acetylcholinesterase-1-like [Varroa jacobsoni]|uniref:acetylcholinesterase-1-like n=1 Tax=Varroa jacobsoni TaxID=62625 RepID=UPI000BF76923|nr:acetylcholinesterase-1-like [Varroa jacobsoni]
MSPVLNSTTCSTKIYITRTLSTIICFICLMSSSIVNNVAAQEPIEVQYVNVKTEVGNLRGYKMRSIEGKDINVFIGVPFAKPPVGKRRFKRPEPLDPVDPNITRDALTKKPMCPQIPMIVPGIRLENEMNDDDCLYMNIFASADTSSSEKKPVMVYFYGGFYQWGDNNLALYDGVEFAAETDSVIAFPAYRVSLFGFLNSTGKSAPGNQGLFDQLLALKFIQRNVEFFGGDLNLVTIAGQSAGAISASIHTSSPATKGLFRRALLLSGAANTLAFFKEADGQNLLFTVANFMDCFNNNRSVVEQYDSMADCLATKDRLALLDQLSKLDGGYKLAFGPGRDGQIIAGDIRRPTTLEYNVEDIMMGTTDTDGELVLRQVMGLEPAFEDLARSSGPDIAVKLALKQMYEISTISAAEMYSAYITDQDTDDGFDAVLKKAPRMFTDVSFDCPAKFYMNSVEKVNGKKTNIYRYVLKEPRAKVFVDAMGAGPATHTDDVMFFLGIALNKDVKRPWDPRTPAALQMTLDNYTDEDRKLAKDILRSVKEFMINGKPTLPGKTDLWPKYSETSPSVVNLTPKTISVTEGPVSKLCHLWAPYLISSDIAELYGFSTTTTTTTTTTKPIYRKAKTIIKNGRRLSKSRHPDRYQNSAPTGNFSHGQGYQQRKTICLT